MVQESDGLTLLGLVAGSAMGGEAQVGCLLRLGLGATSLSLSYSLEERRKKREKKNEGEG